MYLFEHVSRARLSSQIVSVRCLFYFRAARGHISNEKVFGRSLPTNFPLNAQSVINSRRMKRSSADRGGATSRQNGSDGRKRAEQLQSDAEYRRFSFDPTDSQNGENDPRQRKELRSRYRELINTVQREYQDRLSLNTKDSRRPSS